MERGTLKKVRKDDQHLGGKISTLLGPYPVSKGKDEVI